ncbi:hypothetical protein AAEO50_13720 [Rossellomorea oryzaecorticis]|uniref:Uncharacterized protein n=2 Tax=Rossellomorea oryzaecorticis TaxID=1396505 RepID=A0ABU9KC74_9BACI
MILIVAGFLLVAYDHQGESWMMIGLFWLVTGIETSIRAYRKEGKIPFGLSVVFIVAAASLLTVGVTRFLS